MSKFQQYYINLKDLKTDSQTFEFTLDNVYFQKIDSPEVKKGNVNAIITVKKKSDVFELSFQLNGVIQIPCNRCLDDMDQPIQYKEKLQVKFGNRFSEENDTVVVPETDGGINVAWFLYEFIVLNIPIKHVHPSGECNKTMIGKLKKHITRQKSDEEDDDLQDIDFEDDEMETDETPTDPRWDGLQNIFENN
ncbi:conserved hypothetical protein [uncultured Paludibacter sp.]|nr:conserved hypothetical protein [uncultured Paludibacter sp.]